MRQLFRRTSCDQGTIRSTTEALNNKIQGLPRSCVWPAASLLEVPERFSGQRCAAAVITDGSLMCRWWVWVDWMWQLRVLSSKGYHDLNPVIQGRGCCGSCGSCDFRGCRRRRRRRRRRRCCSCK